MSLNEGFAYQERIGPEADGERLLDYLSRRYRHSSAPEWASRLDLGQVSLDGCPAGSDAVLRRGQALAWQRPPWEEPEAPLSFEVLLEDEDILAVAKPAGLPTLPGAGFHERTLLHLVRVKTPGAAPIHRLGRWTSGVVLFGRTEAARASLARQWAARTIGKRYRALAQGCPERDEFPVNAPIGRVPHALLGTVHAALPAGKPAASHVVVIERRESEFLCDVRIATGRPHQIRIHLAAAGHPLTGDPLYGAGGLPGERTRAVPGDPGYHLHAAELTFLHPRTGAGTRMNCPPPPILVPRAAPSFYALARKQV